MLMVSVVSEVFTPSLARIVRIAWPFTSSSVVSKARFFPLSEAEIASSLELLIS
jgi:hypothetical protein